ncbi:MAG TPA: amidohydrolase family protein [Kofleriaceae bacterium]|nr:amidohydrolase family protein [Kofleriaceae bacterium]
MLRILWLLAVIGCGSKAAESVDKPGPTAGHATAFVDVTVVPMDRESTLAHQTVVTRDGKIVALGPIASTRVPDGATTIDGRGRFLIPGLADMHVHTFGPDDLALFVTEGVTSIRVMWGMPGSIGARDAVQHGESRLAPSITTAGTIIDGVPPIWPGSLGVASADEARAIVAAQARAGYDFVKVYNRLSPDVYRAIVDEAGKRGLRVVGHVPSAVTLGGVLDAKQSSIEHLDGWASFVQRADSPVKEAKDFKQRLLAFRYADDGKLADAIARTKAAGTWNCPTLVVFDRISKLDRPDTARPEYRYLPKEQLAAWSPDQDFRFRDWSAKDFEAARDKAAWDLALVKRLSDAGAGILAGTDVGNPWLVPGFSLHDELQLLVAAKLTPYQALVAATRDPARFLGDATAGTIAVGKRADLVLLDGDPLADIRNTTKIRGVMLRGRWLPETELAAARARIAAISSGAKSRFDGAPPLVDRPLFEGRYRGRAQLSGEERFAARNQPDGSFAIVAETRYDREPALRFEIELGAGNGRRMRVTGDGLDVVMVREAGHAKVTGRTGHDTIALDEPIADDEIFGSGPLGADAVAYRTLGKLAVGDTATLKLLVLDISPSIGLHRLSLALRREADATRTIAGKQAQVRVYSLGMFGRKDQIVLDADGWPVETTNQLRQ